MGVNYQKLNVALKDLYTLRRSKRISRQVVHEIDDPDYGSQGDSNEIYEVYDIGLEDGHFVKIRLGSDSYGDNETIEGVQFVKMVEKTVSVFEEVK